MKKINLLFLALSFCSVAGVSASELPKCEEDQLDQISLYTSVRVKEDETVGDKYEQYIQKIEQFAKNHDLQKFKIYSQEISVDSSSYRGDSEVDMSLSVNFTYLADYKVIDKFNAEFEPRSLSSSRYASDECN